ncbi:MAG: M18 family aminopeptidase, partial [Desulfopila sp.]|nr:M18 family aminopeptidase [Desulfopila sp.]
DNGSLVAFNKGLDEEAGFRILGTHSDSPSLKIKPNADIYEKEFHKLGVEIYGGAQLEPWFDRELSLAGRVCYLTTDGNLKIEFVDFNRPIAVIPSIALHLNKNSGQDNPLNPQKHIVPIIGLHKEQKKSFNEILTDHLTIEHKNLHLQQILSYDLFFYDFRKPGYAGIDNEFILSARLDNQLSCFLAATVAASADKNHNFLIICNDHEEIGSKTASGAEGNMLTSFFERIYPDSRQRFTILAKSFLISVDNAHATHPNYSNKHDSSHEIFLNKGPVLKINANQRYATSSPSSAVFKLLCSEVDIQAQDFVMPNDMPCGSTLGPMTAAKVGLKTVDIGAATLAMHSVREMTGRHDPYLLYKVLHHFFTRQHIPEVRQNA